MNDVINMEKIVKFSEIDVDEDIKKYLIDDKLFEELVGKCFESSKKSEIINIVSNANMTCEQKIFFALNYGISLGANSNKIHYAKLKGQN